LTGWDAAQGAAIVTAEAQQFGIEFWIAPIGLLHRRAQVVEVQNLHDTDKTAERVFSNGSRSRSSDKEIAPTLVATLRTR